ALALSSLRFSNGNTAILFSGILCDWLACGAAEATFLFGRVVHHQPRAMAITIGIPPRANLLIGSERVFSLIADFELGTSDFPARAGTSHGRTMRNKSMGTEMFFNSVGANFSKRVSTALRIWRSTSIDTQIPPAPASGSMREAMFTPSP